MSKQDTIYKTMQLLGEKAPWTDISTVFLAYHGSVSYGTSDETSDLDIRGIFVPPVKIIADPYSNIEQVGYHDKKYDILIFDFRKFLKLAAQGNPNIAESLWVEEDDWMIFYPEWKAIHSKRGSFLSKEMCRRFMGYTFNELKTLKNGIISGVGPENSRHHLYEKYGFDTKSAAHALRVSRMCNELVSDGVLKVKRPDAEELKKIRIGQVNVGDLVEEVQQNLMEATNKLPYTPLPEHVDKDFVSKLAEEILEERLFGAL